MKKKNAFTLAYQLEIIKVVALFGGCLFFNEVTFNFSRLTLSLMNF